MRSRPARLAGTASPLPRKAAPPRSTRRDCHGRLLAALQALAGPDCAVEDGGQRPWCSATFIGAQHRIVLHLPGPDAWDRATALTKALPEAEITLVHHIVVDLAVDSVMDGQDGGVEMVLAVLTIEDW
ncbi:hypothetical protein M2337_000371 [Sphingobium sp. B2D3A]|uniref:hypothetical protein n=1 Tax=unclassified Sphingobium TaxID=2611147 RepID=UPI002224CCAA|nr:MULTISPECIES: hypothetical protein [unclassified Sphingobium]MCW2336138.1 hypothetical protein [Sphingobium sp. B2D3A]MCW2385893.1 hypothetical protein [Sphingobium sp. B2D3D]